ncbi:hypothetical protein GLOTRDRAFT_110322 [Gloeophyllum trabeum ATCC 11539]|uniref:Uncharacterized protein n=1 Tax=Gloeophyllum trabeum (strain ATCC 11539 / FP-39264 / Madison 617) TaxID=670483 RepID=S7QBX2_GLOTA|nr:uncharacterized protein GLOTRDRAFT_110322 [Gloeophyllum trabeum ATCC 11539]EPQ56842.1 hypothetical protein GLOTRDRAFT_110322 [Gloeophyllum trabeum ATCC 11539]
MLELVLKKLVKARAARRVARMWQGKLSSRTDMLGIYGSGYPYVPRYAKAQGILRLYDGRKSTHVGSILEQ